MGSTNFALSIMSYFFFFFLPFFLLLDFNECQSNTSNICEQDCVNVPGSFTCDCGKGYKLNADGHSCDGNTLLKMFHDFFIINFWIFQNISS